MARVGYDKLCKMAGAVASSDDLAELLFAVIEEGEEPAPSYWQWKLDHHFLENIASELSLYKKQSFICDHETGARSTPCGEPKTAPDAFRYVALAIVGAIVIE